MTIRAHLEELLTLARLHPDFKAGKHINLNEVYFYIAPSDKYAPPAESYFFFELNGIEITHKEGGLEVEVEEEKNLGLANLRRVLKGIEKNLLGDEVVIKGKRFVRKGSE